MKVLLIGFKLSIGNELYMSMLYNELKKKNIEVDICGDTNYINKYNIGFPIANGGNSKQMIIDTINIFNWIKFYKLLKKAKYDKIFFISSHTLNNIAILIAKKFNIEIISHIHDPIPHSGTNYGWIILYSQKLQAFLSNKIVVYGDKLKDIIVTNYKVSKDKVFVIKHGVYRDNKTNILNIEKKYISLLGRIDEYKGIDVFLKAIKLLDEKLDSKIKFVIGGKGDLSIYEKLIDEVKHRLIIKNYIIPNEEFDKILEESYVLVLPYKDGTQTGNVQVAYYNATPVIVTNVGSIPELIDENKTGFIIEPNDVNTLSEAILKILDSSRYIEMGENAFEYYKQYLRWNVIIDDLIDIFKKDIK